MAAVAASGVLLFFGIFFSLLRYYPLSTTIVAPLLQKNLADFIGDNHVSVRDVTWSMPSLSSPFKVKLHAVKIDLKEQGGEVFLSQAEVSLNWKSFFTKAFVIEELCIPQVSFEKGKLSFSMEGNLSVKFSRPQDFWVNVSSNAFKLNCPDIWAAPLLLDSVQLKASKTYEKLELGELKIKLANTSTEVLLSGSLLGGNKFSFKAQVPKVDLSQLMLLWPLTLAPKVRHWVTSNIRRGTGSVTSCEVKGTLKDGVVVLEKLEGDMTGTDVEVHYLNGFPPVHKTNGKIHFTRETLAIQATGEVANQGEGKPLIMKEAKILITDTHKEDQFIDITLKVQGPVRKQLELISYPPFELPQKFGIVPAQTEGEATTDAHLYFPLEVKVSPEEVKVTATSKIEKGGFKVASETAFPLVFHQGSFDLEADPTRLSLTGKTMLSDMALTLSWKEFFTPSSSIKRECFLKGVMDPPFLKKYGFDLSTYVQHKAPVELTYRLLASNRAEVGGKIDLAPCALFLPVLEWHKPPQSPLSANFSVKELSDKFEAIFGAKGEKVEVKGKGVWKKGASSGTAPSLHMVSFDSFKVGPHDLKIQLFPAPSSTGMKIVLEGETLDLSSHVRKVLDSPAGSDRPLPSFHLDFRLGEILLSNKLSLYETTGMLVAGKNRFRMADIKGYSLTKKVGEKTAKEEKNSQRKKPFSFQMAPKDTATENESFSMESKAAGSFLELFYPDGQLRGGSFTLNGEKKSSSITGKVMLQDFTIKKAPLLTRVLSAVSPGGMIRLLTGKGLRFNQGVIDFSLTDEKITLNPLRFTSPMLAFLLEGALDNRTKQASFKGEVIPFYMANTFLAHLPLLGQILGGRDKEGILAASFSLKGPKDNLVLQINPLSPFTPRAFQKALNENENENEDKELKSVDP